MVGEVVGGWMICEARCAYVCMGGWWAICSLIACVVGGCMGAGWFVWLCMGWVMKQLLAG